MLLTIGMIVKNEEKYLRDCLNALQPILKNISSELIIVDTGSTDRTVEIAKEFTDKVLYFEWIKDFSAARNHGLAQAKGEWFMAVDADEIFMSCDDIISFFKSGEYKNYNSAVYSVRNYNYSDNKNYYSDFRVARLTRLLPETKYVHPVHESLSTFGMPIKVLNDVAEHYGYVFTENNEFTKDKYDRNMELLNARLATDERENNPGLYKELIDTFCIQDNETVEKNAQTAIDYAYKGIEICKKQNSDYILCMYHTLITFYTKLKRHEEVIKVYDMYFAVDEGIRKGIRSTDLDIIGFTANALYLLKRYDEAAEKYEKFFGLLDTVNKNKICTMDALYTTMRLTDGSSLDKVSIYYAASCLNTGRLREAENNIKNYPVSRFQYDSFLYNNRIRQAVFLLSKYDAKEISRIFGGNDDRLKKELFAPLRLAVFNADAKDGGAIANKLAALNLKNAVQRNLASVYKAHFNGGAGAERIGLLLKKAGADYPDILYIMLDEGLDITPFVSLCGNMEGVIDIAYGCMDNFADKLNGYSADNVKDINGIHGAVRLYLNAAIEGAKRNIGIEGMLNTLGNLGIKHLQAFGEKNIPEEVYAAVTVAEINLLRSCRDFKGCIEAVRRLIKLNKRYAPIASVYQALIKAEL